MPNPRALLGTLVAASTVTACASLGKALGTTCVVAARDSAAIIEISGLTAASECKALVESGNYYESEPQDEKPLICVVELSGNKYTVRDQGVFNVVGTQICSQLTNLIPIPTVTFAPTSRSPVTCAVGVPDHDAMIEIRGQTANQLCQALVQNQGFESRSPDREMEVLCAYEFSVSTWTVRDTGGMAYGTDICNDLAVGRLPSP